MPRRSLERCNRQAGQAGRKADKHNFDRQQIEKGPGNESGQQSRNAADRGLSGENLGDQLGRNAPVDHGASRDLHEADAEAGLR